jgi:hypothetical protein
VKAAPPSSLRTSRSRQSSVFARLNSMGAGDEVQVLLNDSQRTASRVTSAVEYALAAIDMGAILKGREGVKASPS